MRSLGAYMRWGLADRSQRWETTVLGSCSETYASVNNPVTESGSFVAQWASSWYVKRRATRGRGGCKGKQRLIGVIWNSCRVRGQKSKLSYRYAEVGTGKKKKKLGMFRSSHCSLYLLVLRKEKELIPFLYFSLQHYLSLNSFFFFHPRF